MANFYALSYYQHMLKYFELYATVNNCNILFTLSNHFYNKKLSGFEYHASIFLVLNFSNFFLYWNFLSIGICYAPKKLPMHSLAEDKVFCFPLMADGNFMLALVGEGGKEQGPQKKSGVSK